MINNSITHAHADNKLFLKYYKLWGGTENHESDNMDLPGCFQKVPKDHEYLPQKLREEARSVLLERKSLECLDNDELQKFWYLLERFHTSHNKNKYMTYENFLAASKEASPKEKQYFTATIFAKLIPDNEKFSRIDIGVFFNYVMKKCWLHQSRVGISLYDVCGEGYLRETDLENYIMELIHTLYHLSDLPKSFEQFYVCTAVRKFFFFLDPLRSGRVRITDILTSGFLDSMLELREVHISEAKLAENWFSYQSTKHVYGNYLLLDEDGNGLLSRREFSRFANGTLTNVFLDRVFEQCLTYDREMDYKTYLDILLAIENKKEPQSIMFLFRILDLSGRGRLNSLTLSYYFDGIIGKSKTNDNEVPCFENIQNEIFDMASPANPDYITVDDLIKCGNGGTIISMLIDLQGFWAHENREYFAAEHLDEAEL